MKRRAVGIVILIFVAGQLDGPVGCDHYLILEVTSELIRRGADLSSGVFPSSRL